MADEIDIKDEVHYHPDRRELHFRYYSSGIINTFLGKGSVNKWVSFFPEELEQLVDLVGRYSWRYKDLGRGWEVRRTLFGNVIFIGQDRFGLYRLKALRLSPEEYSTLEGYLKD